MTLAYPRSHPFLRWIMDVYYNNPNPFLPVFAKAGYDAGVFSYPRSHLFLRWIMEVNYNNPNPFLPAFAKGGVVANAI
jgi:hypothetical protein